MSRDTNRPTGWAQPKQQEQATLLDLMAMGALQGILSAPQHHCLGSAETSAERAYDMAEAMLAERAKRMGVSHE